MGNYVIKYARDERVRYISHLDFIRLFHRTVRRAELDMEFSKGFNPHPVMTVAMPLSVGVTSSCEYMKIGFKDGYTAGEIMERLNNSFPDGYKVLDIREVFGKELDFAKLNRAVYEVDLECNDADAFDENKFLENAELIVMKKSKSGVKESNIKPYIYDFKSEKKTKNKMSLTMCLSAGNDYNLKPESVISAMQKYCDGFEVTFFCTHRVKILADNKEFMC